MVVVGIIFVVNKVIDNVLLPISSQNSHKTTTTKKDSDPLTSGTNDPKDASTRASICTSTDSLSCAHTPED